MELNISDIKSTSLCVLYLLPECPVSLLRDPSLPLQQELRGGVKVCGQEGGGSCQVLVLQECRGHLLARVVGDSPASCLGSAMAGCLA